MSLSNWTQISIASCFLLTAAAGLTVVLITGNIDLSVGSIAYIAASVAYLSADQGPIITILAVIFVGAFLGLINGFLIAYLKMNSLLTTLGLLIAYRGISLVITGGTVQKIGEQLSNFGNYKFFGFFPLIFAVSLILVIGIQFIMKFTRFGRYCYAIGNNEISANKLGIPVKKIKLYSFIIAGICGALSGLLLAMYLGEVTTFTGRGMEFQAVAAIVIGGTSLFGGRGSIMPGTFAGVLLLVIINNGLGSMGVSPYVYPFVAGSIIFLAIYLDSIKNTSSK
ncbi:MAG: ABC transporter permease [Alphaproteobacteria bacterium]|jgi:ribose/xylose/arabinose/galactoside ABC-type transport system permease subunit|tara:strand:+ start:3965 stop:4807 length:843 start_codon:yes stop_codon:yes gene_type:complete